VRLRQHAQRLDELEERLKLAARARIERARARHAAAASLLLRASPAIRVQAQRIRLESARRALNAGIRGSISGAQRRFELAGRTLHAVSPLATLDRGYAIVADAAGKVVQDAGSLTAGDRVEARLARGRFSATVTGTAQEADAVTEIER
jgi:exodeoxyribonuclease VII large subunit